MRRKQPLRPFTLTARDIAVIQLVTERRGIPLDVLAAELFAVDPFTKKPNTNPKRACEQRLRVLRAAGYLLVVSQHDGRERRKLVVAGNAARNVTCARADQRRVSLRTGAHHVRTQDAVTKIEAGLRRMGGKVLSVQLEAEVRAAAQKGRRVRRGDSFPAFPDAVVKVDMPKLGVGEIAVEYVTSKYTDADILRKHNSFVRFHSVVWVADRQRTAERVRALTGSTCTTLR